MLREDTFRCNNNYYYTNRRHFEVSMVMPFSDDRFVYTCCTKAIGRRGG